MAPPGSFDLRAKFRAVSAALRANYEALGVGGDHRYEKGIRKEDLLCEFLARHLPAKYGVARGEIVAASGGMSRQIDVVIYDAFHAPLLQDSPVSRVFPAESVYAVIELKPLLHLTGLREAIETISSAKALPRSAIVEQHGGHRILHGPRENPPYFAAVFALQSSTLATHIVPQLAELHRHLPLEQHIDCVCSLDRGLVYHFLPHPDLRRLNQWVPTVLREGARLGYYDSADPALLLFYLFLLYQLNAKELFPPDLLQYVRGVDAPRPTIYRPESPAP